jgi:hypothetical protein
MNPIGLSKIFKRLKVRLKSSTGMLTNSTTFRVAVGTHLLAVEVKKKIDIDDKNNNNKNIFLLSCSERPWLSVSYIIISELIDSSEIEDFFNRLQNVLLANFGKFPPYEPFYRLAISRPQTLCQVHYGNFQWGCSK